MSGFLYCRVGDQRLPSIDEIKAWGLFYAFPGGSFETRPVSSSPGGGQGCVIGPSSATAVGYFPAKQTWRKMPIIDGRPELWVGYYTDAKPTPESLQRPVMLRGPKIKLTDGHAWQIPIIRRFDSAAQTWHSELPAYLDLDDRGKPITGAPLKEYAALWDVTAPLADRRLSVEAGDEAPEVTEDQVIEAVVALMAANYRVGLPELVLLGSLQESDLAMIAMVSCRYEALLKWLSAQKKTDDPSTPSGEITADGEAA